MKLLSKNEIDQKKAVEYRQSREEGLKLARRVDSLREVQAQEESSLQKFRTETLAKIHEETKQAATRRDDLISECRSLENARRNALKPLTEELAHIEGEKVALEEKKIEHTRKEGLLVEREGRVKASENSTSLELSRAIEERRRATELLQETDYFNSETRLRLAETEAIRDKTKRMQEDVEKDFRERDVEIASKERSLATWQKDLENREDALGKATRKLADRQATLERSIKRNKK